MSDRMTPVANPMRRLISFKRLKVARVGDDVTQVGELVNKFDITVAYIPSYGGDRTSPNFMILVLAHIGCSETEFAGIEDG